MNVKQTYRPNLFSSQFRIPFVMIDLCMLSELPKSQHAGPPSPNRCNKDMNSQHLWLYLCERRKAQSLLVSFRPR